MTISVAMRTARWPLSPTERFWTKVDKAGPIPWLRPDLGPCWIWTSQLCRNGYARFKVGAKYHAAHRWLWELDGSRVPNGMELDHLCVVRNCVNPVHLEPVTKRINTLRGSGPTAVNSRLSHCRRGHEFTEANTYVWKRIYGRRCRQCARERTRNVP